MKEDTALHIAHVVYEDNEPIDWAKIERIKKRYTQKERLDWARGCIEPYVSCSKHKITRAANELLVLLGLR